MDFNKIISTTKAEPRPYQQRIVEKVYNNFIDRGVRSVLVESPTGSGKTVMALLTAKVLHEELGARIGWVAMRRYLLKQAQQENINKGFNLPITFISMFDKNPPTNIDLLIVDEAQHDATNSMAHIHTVTAPKYLVGQTAVPWRADRVKLCFDMIIKDAGIPTLIRDGYLSTYHHYTIPKWGIDEVTSLYLSDKARWGKSIMYFHTLEQCFSALQLLQNAGVNADVVHGSSDTDKQIEDFHANKLSVLLNCMKLTEGFDCVDLKTVFCRPSCKGVTIQMAGRVLRKHPDYQYKQIVQCEKTPHPFPKTALAAIQHVLSPDGSWRTLQVNENIDSINKRVVCSLARIDTEMPAYMKMRLTKKGFRNTPSWVNSRNIENQNTAVAQLDNQQL